jgi:hypothetical protein
VAAVGATSALWTAMQRDVARERRARILAANVRDSDVAVKAEA